MITYAHDKPVRLIGKARDLSDRGFLFLRSVGGLGIPILIQFPVISDMVIAVDSDDHAPSLELCNLSRELSSWPSYGRGDVVQQLAFVNAVNLLRYMSRSVEQGILGTVISRAGSGLDFVPSVHDIVRMTPRVSYPNSLYQMDRLCVVMGQGLLWQHNSWFSCGVVQKFFSGYRASLLGDSSLEDSSLEDSS